MSTRPAPRLEVIAGRIGVATFSACRRYRYLATYPVGSAPGRRPPRRVVFVMLNPSTADHDQLDPTIRRCVDFAARAAAARRWPHATLTIANLYAFRATLPADLWRATAPVGAGNDAAILDTCRAADLVVCGWGNHGARDGRGDATRARLVAAGVRLHHLGLTAGAQPRHPLYLRATTSLQRWSS